MQLSIHGHNMEVTTRLQDYIERKVGKLDRFLPDYVEVRVDLTSEQTRDADDRQAAQFTVRGTRGPILRAEERSDDMFYAIDAALDKISRQVRRVKGRRQDRRRGEGGGEMVPVMMEEPVSEEESDDESPLGTVVRRKRFGVEPMAEEEAIEQMELLGHDFFVFYNADTASVNVLYRRKDGNYGLLQPEVG